MIEATLANKLRDAIRAQGKRQRTVAREMGISDQYLSDILHKRRLVSANAAIAFERVLGLDALGVLYMQTIEVLSKARLEGYREQSP